MVQRRGFVLRSDSSFAVPILSGRRTDVLRRVGFTLIELLVVISIIVLLMASVTATTAQTTTDKATQKRIEELIAQLRDENMGVRHYAVRSLGEIGDPRAVQPLIKALGNSNRSIRQLAANALGRIGDPRAVQPLINALKDVDENVRKYAATALVKIGGPAVQPLIKALGDRNVIVRLTAATALGQIGDPQAVQPLINALGDRNSSVRLDAARALGRIGDPQAVQSLIKALGDEHSYVQANAASALVKIGKPAVQPLIKALGDKESKVRQFAAMALGNIGNKQAVQPLKNALKDENEHVRQSAARALAQIKSKPTYLKKALKALKDENLWMLIPILVGVLVVSMGMILGVLYTAYEAISSINWPSTTGTITQSELAETIQELLIAGPELVPVPGITYTYIVDGKKLQGNRINLFEIRFCSYSEESAQRVLDQYPLNSKVKVCYNPRNPSNAFLIPGSTILSDEDDQYSSETDEETFSEIDELPTAQSLINDLGDEDPLVRKNAAVNLGETGDKQALKPLAKALKDEEQSVRKVAKESLIQVLIKTLDDEDPRARAAAAKALGQIGDKRAIKPLIKALKDEDQGASIAAKEAVTKIKNRCDITNKQKGFTLIELLVVIAIIALLMGILMPALSATANSGQAFFHLRVPPELVEGITKNEGLFGQALGLVKHLMSITESTSPN